MSKKGTFGKVGLPFADKYVYPISRNRLLMAAAAGVIALLIVLGLSRLLTGDRFLAKGPLSSNHANFENECSTCHESFAAASDEKCAVCHEKFGDELGVYSFATHYLYRSGDFQRVIPRDGEQPCIACHPEHNGRDGSLVDVRDAQCRACHEFGSFADGHPEFQFAADNIPDEANLRFPHTMHVREIVKREGLTDVEKACLYCHNAEADGAGFRPVSFDRHCSACHLNGATATHWLSTWTPSAGASAPGVEALEAMRARGGLGTAWTSFVSAKDFRQRGDVVQKNPVRHADPWILENLRQLRKALYRNTGLGDLLAVSARVPPSDTRVLYEEAIATLRDYSRELRAQPQAEVQADLDQIDSYLETASRRLENPYTPLDDAVFVTGEEHLNPDLSPEQIAHFESFIDTLTAPCQKCHLLEDGAIARVQEDQKTLRRANFNHRAHILQRRCLDCHATIPIGDLAAGAEPIDPALDHSGIQNLPSIVRCRECHNDHQVSERCVGCHDFHANKEQRSNLLLYVD